MMFLMSKPATGPVITPQGRLKIFAAGVLFLALGYWLMANGIYVGTNAKGQLFLSWCSSCEYPVNKGGSSELKSAD
jgi:hypothetical protein